MNVKMKMNDYIQKINRLEAKKELLTNDLNKKKNQLEKHKKEKEAAQEAKIILQLAGKNTQKNLEMHFSDLVTKALHIVFDDPYIFSPEFVERRNKTECDLWLKRNEEKYRPRFAVGGGVLDVIAFSLRLAYWKLENADSVIILDEPFKNLSRTLIPKAAETLRYISNSFNLQMIIVTHSPEITEQGNKVFNIEEGEIKEVL